MHFTPNRLALCVALACAAFAPVALAKAYQIDSATTDTLELKKADTLQVTANGSIVAGNDDGVVLPKHTSGATLTLDNAGIIRSTDGRGIDTKDHGEDLSHYQITNRTGALIQGTNDGLRFQTNPTAGGSLSVINAGTIASTVEGQAIDLETLNNPAFTTTLVNETTGMIHAVGNDAIKTGSNATVTNYGLIYTDTAPQDKNGQDQKWDGIKIGNSTGVTVYNHGTISADRHGVDLKTDATLYNYEGASVTGRNGSGFGSDGSGTVYNWGTITGAIADGKINGDGDGVDIDNIGHVYNAGTIQGLGAKGVDSGGRPNGSEGIAMGGGSIVNTATGVIRSVDNGILVDDGAEGAGVAATTLANAGRIEGESGFGIKLIGEYDDSVTNSGTISGGNGLALSLGAGNDSLTVLTGGVFHGLVDGGEGIDELALNGTGSFGNSANFETLRVSGGSWTLSSVDDFSQGGVVTSGATLVNQGSILGELLIEQGATYAGGGSVGGLQVDGTLLTNTGMGVAAVAGDLSFGQGSSLMYGVNADGSSAPISVSGTANLDGATLRVQPSAGEYPWHSHYTLLTAGAVNGTFAQLSSDYAFLTPTLSYSSTAVGLDYTRNDVAFEHYAQSGNAAGAARSLASLGQNSNLYNAVLGTTTAGAGNAIEQLSASNTANLAAATLASTAQVGSSMLGAVRAMGSSSSLLVGLSDGDRPALAATGVPREARDLNDPTAQGRVWGQALGSYGKVDGSHGASALEQRTGGAVLGIDWALAGDWRLGLLGGYSRTRLDSTGLDGTVRSWHAGVYAQRQSGPLALRLGAAYSSHDGDSKRDVAFVGFNERLKGDYDADSQQAFVELGYAMGSGRLGAEPFANLGYQRYHRDSYREQGGDAALAVDADTQDNLSSTFGVRLAHLAQLDNGMSVTPRATLGWRHTYGSIDTRTRQAFIAGGDAFSVEGSAIDRDSLLVEAGLDLGLSARQSIGLGYSGELGSNSRNHAVVGQWQVKF